MQEYSFNSVKESPQDISREPLQNPLNTFKSIWISIIVMSVCLLLTIVLSSTAMTYSLKNSTNLSSTQQITLQNITSQTAITKENCFQAKCFTDSYIAPKFSNIHSLPSVNFSASQGNIMCTDISAQTLRLKSDALTTINLSSDDIEIFNST